MNDRKIRDLGDLPNKPLAEAMFELRWALEPSGPGVTHDPAWQLLPGIYYSRVRKEYPTSVDLPASQLPADMSGYMVRHQFRAGPDRWPVTQLGPGILTVNETIGYSVWEDFRPRITQAIDVLVDVYSESDVVFQPIQAELRYINADPLDPGDWTPTEFLRERLHVDIGTAPHLFEGEELADSPSEMNLSLTVPLKDPDGQGRLTFATGKKNDRPSLIWQLAVRSQGPDLPSDPKKLEPWLDSAHRIIKRWFLALTEGDLLESYKEAPIASDHS